MARQRYRFRIFTLDEVNDILPMVIELTDDTQSRLDRLRASYRDEADAPTKDFEAEGRTLLDEWVRMILELGAQPKGIFTVDFRTPDPNVLWCWSPGEGEITHRHFAWESFKDRVSIHGDRPRWPSWN